MSKRLLLFATILAFIFPECSFAAMADTLFKIPDTVCVGHKIVPTEIETGGSTYSWTFCPPQLGDVPEGINFGSTFGLVLPNGITVVQDGEDYTGFAINNDGTLLRMTFPDGLESAPVAELLGDMGGNMPVSPKGVQLVQDAAGWHLFVIGGSGLANTSLARFDFADGLAEDVTATVNLGNTDGLLEIPSQLFISQDPLDGNWYGFTFNNGTDMIRINFGSNVTSMPTATVLGNISGAFSGVSGICGILEDGNWHLFATNRISNTLTHITFGNSLTNIPFAVDLGNMGNRLVAPSGIAITKGCEDYYGYVLNNGGSGLVRIYWSASIADAPASATLLGNMAGMAQPRALSQFATENGGLYLFTPNSDNSLSQINFPACTTSSIASSDEQTPPPFWYSAPDVYTVYLTVDQGLPSIKTYCKDIVVRAAPPLTVSNDTLICGGDSITLYGLSSASDSFKWIPDFNIDTTEGKIVRIWPSYTTSYLLTVYYEENCIITDSINVTVSKIGADAGHDREFTDGATAILGGPGTTLGSQYTYRWFPSDFITGDLDSAITTARPDKDITYYLEVRNTDGCYAIDSVIVSVPCDSINMPNAFVPGSNNQKTSTFGLANLQIVKLNYFRVFDRWGKVVFATTDPNGRWNGMVEGKEAPVGVYVWDIDGFCNAEGNRLRRSGTVTLIR